MKMNQMLHAVTLTLVLVGALNWGLVGLFSFNLVESLGFPSGLVQTVYVLVGASAVYMLLTHKDECMTCMAMMGKKGKKK
jgi:hypothetical protein